jgi:hypothetical protein
VEKNEGRRLVWLRQDSKSLLLMLLSVSFLFGYRLHANHDSCDN